jgi:integrase/recombinase XerD
MKKLLQAVHDYLFVRRTLGYKLEREGTLLPEFVRFLKRHDASFITVDLALAWATERPASPNWWRGRFIMVRQFARYAHTLDKRNEIPPADLLPIRKARVTYVYSEAEIGALLRACNVFHCSLMQATYATLIGLLAVTGIRIGEARALNRSDFNAEQGILTIRSGKFGKSRHIPIHCSTTAALLTYARHRDRVIRHAKSESFFISQWGTRLLPQNVRLNFKHIRRHAGLERPHMRAPRIHDLRHTFAVRTLLRWQKGDVPIGPWLPVLSTYMGHVSPSSTYWYLTGTPELLALAAKHLEKTLGDLV